MKPNMIQQNYKPINITIIPKVSLKCSPEIRRESFYIPSLLLPNSFGIDFFPPFFFFDDPAPFSTFWIQH